MVLDIGMTKFSYTEVQRLEQNEQLNRELKAKSISIAVTTETTNKLRGEIFG